MPKMSRNMATKEQIKALKIDENVWNWERIQNRTSNVSKGEPTTSWTGPHLHYLNEKQLSL